MRHLYTMPSSKWVRYDGDGPTFVCVLCLSVAKELIDIPLDAPDVGQHPPVYPETGLHRAEVLLTVV